MFTFTKTEKLDLTIITKIFRLRTFFDYEYSRANQMDEREKLTSIPYRGH